MLLLGRRRGERIRIDIPGAPPVWVSVARISRDDVRLGFEAAKSVRIRREELINPYQDMEERDAASA